MILELIVGLFVLLLVAIVAYLTPFAISKIKYTPKLPTEHGDRFIYGFFSLGIIIMVIYMLAFVRFLGWMILL